jgi:phage-related protein
LGITPNFDTDKVIDAVKNQLSSTASEIGEKVHNTISKFEKKVSSFKNKISNKIFELLNGGKLEGLAELYVEDFVENFEKGSNNHIKNS